MAKAHYYFGIDIGGTFSKIALVSEQGRVMAKEIIKTPLKNKKTLINKIVSTCEKILSDKSVKKSRLRALGAGLPGSIDSKKGMVRSLTNIPGWKNVPLKKILESKLKIKTYIDNDVNLMTLGELYHGAGRDAKNLICVTLGTGVGGGIVMDGKLRRGAGMAAGEIGHIPINEDGPRCNCGGRACVESYIGNRYLMRELKSSLRSNKSVIKKLLKKDGVKLCLKLVGKAALMGDRFSIKFWEEAGVKLGIILTGVINLLNPEKVIIGGGIANAGKFLLNPIRKTVKKRAMKTQARSVKIVRAKLGGDAGVIGAAAFARERISK